MMLMWQLIKTRCFNAEKWTKIFQVTENQKVVKAKQNCGRLVQGSSSKDLWSIKEYEWFPRGKLYYYGSQMTSHCCLGAGRLAMVATKLQVTFHLTVLDIHKTGYFRSVRSPKFFCRWSFNLISWINCLSWHLASPDNCGIIHVCI